MSELQLQEFLNSDEELSSLLTTLTFSALITAFTGKFSCIQDQNYFNNIFTAFLVFDDVYPTVLNGKKSNGEAVQLNVCPEDIDFIQQSFPENQVGNHIKILTLDYYSIFYRY